MPGHEVVGVIDAVGSGVARWKPGQRVGVGWHGGNCGYCDACRRGDFFACQTFTAITGVTSDGGYAEYMIARAEALALVPDELSRGGGGAADVRRRDDVQLPAQQRCAAGRSGGRTRARRPGPSRRPVRRQGGLPDRGDRARQRQGAAGPPTRRRHYIDSQSQDPAAELRNLGGAKVILATVTNGDAMAAVVGGLATNGTLMVIGAAPSLTVSPGQICSAGRRSVKGWYSGTSIDSQDTLAFSVLAGVRSMNEVFPLERVDEAYERMMSGKARFRVVLTMGG